MYRQPYRQGPPPPNQQQSYYDQHAQQDYSNDQPNRMYNERNQDYSRNDDGYRNEQPYHYNDYQYRQNEHNEQWDRGQYQESQHHDQYQGNQYQPTQPHDQAATQDRSYQYDNRYRTNPQTRKPMQPEQGRFATASGSTRPGTSMDRFGNVSASNGNYGYRERPVGSPKVQQRILQQEPESPKTSSWDNPFPAFPSKKKPAEPKRPDSHEQKINVAGSSTQFQDEHRPSTSHSNRQYAEPLPQTEINRPHTSQSYRNFEASKSPVDVPAMPSRREPFDPSVRPATSHSQRISARSHAAETPAQRNFSASRPQPDFRHDASIMHEEARPVPRRVMTGPTPGRPLDSYSRREDHFAEAVTDTAPAYDDYLSEYHSNEHGYENTSTPNNHTKEINPTYPQEQRKAATSTPYGGSAMGHRRQSSSQSYRGAPSTGTQNYDSGSYRGVPLTKKISPDVPNFDVLSDPNTERDEDHMDQTRNASHQFQAYSKPKYQGSAASVPASHQRNSNETGNDLSSPLAQFSFGLDNNSLPGRPQQTPNYHETRYNSQQDPGPQRFPAQGTERQGPFPQRSVSRPQEVPSNISNGYYTHQRPQGNPPVRPGLGQAPTPNQNYEAHHQNYEYNRPSGEDGYSRSETAPSQGSYRSDSFRQGFDQRIQPRPGFVPQQAPPRPATSNSARTGTMTSYEDRTSSDGYQRNGMQNPDSLPAHPAPFRPGLLQSAPSFSRPTPQPQAQAQAQAQTQAQPPGHQRTVSAAKAAGDSEPPVTIGELNALREEYKNRQNDHALGLKFAKRLVEAAKVLASENGRADAKQTAKNRERYTLDGHKIVKRLCGSGYPEAMFYLADCYGQGLLGLESDPKEAFSYYQSAAKLGHAQAAYRVAVCCELGTEEGGGTRRDPLKAVQWYKRAASLGDTPAMYKMGMIQLKGLLGQSKNPREAISWLKRAAERADAENPHALHELGLLYENAQPTDIILRDEKYALQLFQQAADLNYKYSQFRLGSAYEYGLLGLPIDPRMSITWYSRAAKQGEHQSEFALSGWYLTGSGQAGPGEQALLQQSDTEAYLWARKAASSGLAKAEYAMGYYTEVGIGVSSNIEEAKRWYYRAAAQNHPKARERLEDLKKGGQRMQKTRVSRSNVGKHNEGECTVM